MFKVKQNAIQFEYECVQLQAKARPRDGRFEICVLPWVAVSFIVIASALGRVKGRARPLEATLAQLNATF